MHVKAKILAEPMVWLSSFFLSGLLYRKTPEAMTHDAFMVSAIHELIGDTRQRRSGPVPSLPIMLLMEMNMTLWMYTKNTFWQSKG